MGLSEWAPQPYKGFYGTDISTHTVKLKDKSSAFFVAEDFFPLWLKISFILWPEDFIEYMFLTYF